ncbi:MAG: ATP-binding protein [Clostridiales bacterium]|nr:ATP-binding protein [Clostridiales bacterium]
MLCQYSVKNFKSIKEEVTFDMQATSIKEHEDRVIVCADGEKFLPIASIYGPNGGGKSNLLESLFTLRAKIMRPIFATKNEKFKDIRNIIYPYMFSQENAPTEFEIFFRTEISEYRYFISICKETVVKETLDQIKFDTRRKSEIFSREDSKIILKGVVSNLKVPEISSSIPLLSYLYILYSSNETIKDVVKWFEHDLIVLNYDNSLFERNILALSDEYKDLKLQILQEMDIDIVNYRIEKTGENTIQILTVHNVDGHEAEIDFYDESSGTRKIFGMLTFIIDSILNGKTLVVDEMDAKIHPSLLEYIICLFNNFEINKRNAQLIITSHDLTTMNSELFRRDEIWFVAKGNEQNSQLYSLVEFKKNGKKVRNDARFDKQYLEGKYGADPYLKKIINWEEISA